MSPTLTIRDDKEGFKLLPSPLPFPPAHSVPACPSLFPSPAEGRSFWGRLKRSARAVQLFGCLAVLEPHALRS